MGNYIIINRTIDKPIDYVDIAVSGDSNSKVLSFTIERYFDNLDLSTKTINVLYINSLDYSGVGSATITKVENDFIYFDWTIGRDALENAGEVYFAVEFTEKNASVNAIYVWRTKPTTLEVENGLISDDTAIPSSYIDDISFYNNNRNTETNTMKALSRMRIQYRDIMLLPQLDHLIIEQDSNSKILSFAMDRYYDNVDMSAKLIAIKFINGEDEGGRAVAVNVTYDADTLYFDWLVDSRVTKYGGSISFAVQVTGYEGDQFYVWQTKPAYFLIEEGLVVENGDYIIPLDYSDQLEFAYENSNFDLIDMIDEGLPLYVKNRTIELDNQKDITVKADNFSQLVTIRIPRYFDNVDLTKKIITVKYLNADGEGDRSSIVNMDYNDEFINVGWLLDSRFTKTAGDGYFALEIIGLHSNGDPYIWQTTPTLITIRDGIGAVEGIIPPDPSWLESIYFEISKRADGLIFDEDTNLLQLTAGGHPIGDPVDIFGKNFGDMRKEVFATNSKAGEGYVDKAIGADKLVTPRIFSVTGDILALGVEFDGSNDVSFNATINNSMVAGTYTKVKVNNRGLVVDSATLLESDIPNLHLSKIVDAGTAAGRDVGTNAGNVVEVNSDGVIDPSLITGALTPSVYNVTSEASMLALSAKKGDMAIRRDVNSAFVLSNSSPENLASWFELPFDANFTANFTKSFSTGLMDGDIIVRVDGNNHATISVDAADKLSSPFALDFTNDSDIHMAQPSMIDGSADVDLKVRTDAVLLRGEFTPTQAQPYPLTPSAGDTYKVLVDWEWDSNTKVRAGGMITYTKWNTWEVLGSGVQSFTIQKYLEEGDWISNNTYPEYYFYATTIYDARIKKDDVAQVFYDIDIDLDEEYGLAPFVYTYDGYMILYCVEPPLFVYAVIIVTPVPPRPAVPPTSIVVEPVPEFPATDSYQLQWQVMPPVAPQDVIFSSPSIPNKIVVSEDGVVTQTTIYDSTEIYQVTVTAKDYPEISTVVDVPIYAVPTTIGVYVTDNVADCTINRTNNEFRVMTSPQNSISSCSVEITNQDLINVTSISPSLNAFTSDTITYKYDTKGDVGQFTVKATSTYAAKTGSKTIYIHPEPTSIDLVPRVGMVINDRFRKYQVLNRVLPYTSAHPYNNAIQTLNHSILTPDTIAMRQLTPTMYGDNFAAISLGTGSVKYWSTENAGIENTFTVDVLPITSYEVRCVTSSNLSTDPKKYIFKLAAHHTLPINIYPYSLVINGEEVFNNTSYLSTATFTSNKISLLSGEPSSFTISDYITDEVITVTNINEPSFSDQFTVTILPYGS